MTGFVKIYGSQLLGSSLMDEDVSTRWLFLCLCSAADPGGFVRCQTIKAAARLANITKGQASRGLDTLAAPDPDSTTEEQEGRRILRVEGGWQLVNYDKYREMQTDQQRKWADQKRRQREGGQVREVRPSPPRSTLKEKEEENTKAENVGTEDPPAYLPEQRAENATRDKIHSLQLRLGALLCQLSEHENSRLMVPDWCRKVSSYQRDGRAVRGFADYRVITSIPRLEKSIADAEWWLAEMDKGRLIA